MGSPGGGGGNQAQSLNQLQTILQQLGGGAGSPAGQAQPSMGGALTSLGTNMMKPGMQAPSPPPQALARPMIGAGMGPGVPVPQGAGPQMGGQMTGGQGMPIGLMNLSLARQNGMF